MDGCPLGLGLVVEDKPTEFSCKSMFELFLQGLYYIRSMLVTAAGKIPSLGEQLSSYSHEWQIVESMVRLVKGRCNRLLFVITSFCYTGSKVESKGITSRNIQQYVPIIIRNKILLTDKERYD